MRMEGEMERERGEPRNKNANRNCPPYLTHQCAARRQIHRLHHHAILPLLPEFAGLGVAALQRVRVADVERVQCVAGGAARARLGRAAAGAHVEVLRRPVADIVGVRNFIAAPRVVRRGAAPARPLALRACGCALGGGE